MLAFPEHRHCHHRPPTVVVEHLLMNVQGQATHVGDLQRPPLLRGPTDERVVKRDLDLPQPIQHLVAGAVRRSHEEVLLGLIELHQ